MKSSEFLGCSSGQWRMCVIFDTPFHPPSHICVGMILNAAMSLDHPVFHTLNTTSWIVHKNLSLSLHPPSLLSFFPSFIFVISAFSLPAFIIPSFLPTISTVVSPPSFPPSLARLVLSSFLPSFLPTSIVPSLSLSLSPSSSVFLPLYLSTVVPAVLQSIIVDCNVDRLSKCCSVSPLSSPTNRIVLLFVL